MMEETLLLAFLNGQMWTLDIHGGVGITVGQRLGVNRESGGDEIR